MNKLYISAVVVGLSATVSLAKAADFSSYSSRAALIGQPQEVTVGVLAAGSSASMVGGAVGATSTDVSNYSTKMAGTWYRNKTAIPAVSASTQIAVYNTRVALRGERAPSIELAPLK